MTDQEFIQICTTAESMSTAAKLVGMPFYEFKVKALNLNCYDPCKGKRHKLINSQEKLQEILDGKHPTFQPYKLKKLLFKYKLKENKCEECGISEWNKKPIECQLHHKDGNKFNNKLENLKILCPNCHSQTETFGYKQGKKYKNI